MEYNCVFSQPINIGSSTEFYAFSVQNCSTTASSSIGISNGFFDGDVVISVFLFLILLLEILSFFFETVRGTKIKNV